LFRFVIIDFLGLFEESKMPGVHTFTVVPALPKELEDLDFIARNVYWCWNLDIVNLFNRIDSRLWKAYSHNPIKLLGTVSQQRLDELAQNRGFVSQVKHARQKLDAYLSSPTWYEKNSAKSGKIVIAYFSAEFGLHESLPFYSGGLGLLAGDHMKSASDLGIPLVGVSLLYQKGYFRQYLNIDGWQQEVFSDNDIYNMPVELVVDKAGLPVKIAVDYPSRKVAAQIWAVSIGRIKLYLLDTNLPENSSQDRMITANLYGGDLDMRITQEILLGIGGFRALAAMGITPAVCHMNEGHAAFMALERIRSLKEKTDMTFEQAIEATKAGNCFTIHTPIQAGNDEFPPELIDKYFAEFYPSLGIDHQKFMSLGRLTPKDEKETFKMPVLALKLSAYRNGVSKLHGRVSRKIWSTLWPELPEDEVPITSITNGVHIKSWLSEEINSLYERYLGANWAEEITEGLNWDAVEQIPDEEFWRIHQRSRESLVAFTRSRLKAQMQRRGTYHTELNWAEEVLDPQALTVGFARRFTTYKRGNLLLQEPARFVKLLSDAEKPIQFIFAGKAHPKDTQGKEIIRQIIHFASQYNVRRRIVFLEDYDINVARYLLRGVDIWLNTPRPPLEASGTSGMKAALNGALNISTLDGWWCEGYRPQGGWAVGNGEIYQDTAYQDAIESKALFNILEKEVIPLFYTRCVDGLPRAWINRVKQSIKWITPIFNTHRMVAEYASRFYNPAADQFRYLTEKSMMRAKALADWKTKINSNWTDLAIKDVQATIKNGFPEKPFKPEQSPVKVGSELTVKAFLRLGSIKPGEVSVQLYHGQVDSWGNITEGSFVPMDCRGETNNDGDYLFTGSISFTSSGRQGYAVRVLPRNDDLVNANDLGLVLWESKN
jgi:starch phosphorylase